MQKVIRKSALVCNNANMPDYDAKVGSFSWSTCRTLLEGLPVGKLNIAHEALERHVQDGHAEKPALIWLGRRGERKQFSYRDLVAATGHFANVLHKIGVNESERVFTLLARVPELYITALGTLRAGGVFCPLFSAFGPEPIKARMQIGDAAVLVTTSALYRRKVAPIRDELPALRAVLLIDTNETNTPDPTDPTIHSLPALMSEASDHFETVATDPRDWALLHFTSGTTGKPKGVVHVHEAVVAHYMTGKLALDLKPDDIYWCTADPGWVTGTSYGIVAPLTIGATMIIDESEFNAPRWYKILQDEHVSVWYTAPTAIRMLMKAGADLVKEYDLSPLRFLASVGEPLNAQAVVWAADTFGTPFHDNWWQTETGGIMIANFASVDVKPGSMGKPMPGITAAIVEKTAQGISPIDEPMVIGELALKSGWPSMMRGYLNEEKRYQQCFANGWYLSGDLAMRDVDGYFWFVGRGDDLIKSAGHLIGPFEVENALMEHPAVAEVGVIGVPDETAGEVVKAFVALNKGFVPNEQTRRDVLGHARKRLGPAVAPKLIDFRENLPKTRSGKIMRRLLKARELGLPEGDISTLESDEQ